MSSYEYLIFIKKVQENPWTPVEMANTGARVPKMAVHHISVTPASEPASCLQRQNTDEEVPGYLATLSHRHN